MALKKTRQAGLLIAAFFLMISPQTEAQTSLGEFITIDTHLNCVLETPRWLLILRDLESGQVLPYLYDFYGRYNHWIALSYGHVYQITVSKMTFGPSAVINNFCGLEHHVLMHVSMYISLTGALTPDRMSSQCHITYLKDYPLSFATGA